MLLLINIIPIGLGIYLFVLHTRGELVLQELPSGFVGNLVVVGACILLLIVVASFSLPVAHDTVKSLRRKAQSCLAIVRGEQTGSRIGNLLLLLPLGLARLTAWLVRAFLMVLSLALIAGLFLFLARLRWPDLAQEEINRSLDYLQSLVK
jgi:hypothetical protein